MLNLDEIDRLVDRAATASLKGLKLSKVYSKPAIDSDGKEALHVTLVINTDKEHEITGDMAVDIIVQIQRDLQNSGEERFAIVDFTNPEEELASNGSP